MTMVRDVVCGMDIQAETAADSSEYRENVYYFCSSDCKRAFDQDPEHYLEPYRDNRDVTFFLPVAALAPGTGSSGQPVVAPVVPVVGTDMDDDVAINVPATDAPATDAPERDPSRW